MKKIISIGLIGMFMCIMLPMSTECRTIQAFADDGEVAVASAGTDIQTAHLDVIGDSSVVKPNYGTQIFHNYGYGNTITITQEYTVTAEASGELEADFVVLQGSIGVAGSVS
ncbi:MAG: hypothetical protein ACI4U2_03420, partial [Christensenellaceae bacterium]